MSITERTFAVAALGLFVLSTPTSAGAEDRLKFAGAWKLVSFFTEDVETKTRNNIYGEHPKGYLGVTVDGRFFAFASADWRKFAVPPSEQIQFRSIFYSGKYRVEGDKFVTTTDTVSQEGWEGTDPFDMSWNEGWLGGPQVRFYMIETDREHERLTLQTAPMRNPNGAGNMIVGTVIWQRE